MIERFEKLTTGITQVYKAIQRIKKHRMGSIGLKGSHVMCMYYLNNAPRGLTASNLCTLCQEDKAGISRVLSDLEANQFITYDYSSDKKKYRANAILTPKGAEYALKVNELIMGAVIAGSDGISEEDRRTFYRILFLIAENLNQLCNELDEKSERISTQL